MIMVTNLIASTPTPMIKTRPTPPISAPLPKSGSRLEMVVLIKMMKSRTRSSPGIKIVMTNVVADSRLPAENTIRRQTR